METTPGPGRIIAGRYRLADQLGQGGMGSVWRAEHLALRSPVAVKLIDPEIAGRKDMLERFQREAMAAAALRSPHVVQILDYGVDEGVPYIVMELLDGESLADRLLRVRRLALSETARIVTHVARALGRAHEAGIVHRDLKPDNVFLVRNDEEEVAKVLDFGVAKHGSLGSGKGPTRTGNILGTPGYMSPEQAQGTKAVDGRSDLWALGVIAYECIVGHVPFESEALGDLLLKICVQPIPVPSQHGQVPPGFDAWFARACCREVEQRFQSAKELADALRAVLAPGAGDRSSSAISADALASRALASAQGAPGAPTVAVASSGVVTGRAEPPGATPVPAGGPTLASPGPAPASPTRVPGGTTPGIAVALPEAPRRSAGALIALVVVLALGAGGAATWFVAGRREPPPPPTSALLPLAPTQQPGASVPSPAPATPPTVEPAAALTATPGPSSSAEAPPAATATPATPARGRGAAPRPAPPPPPAPRNGPPAAKPGGDRLGF